APDSWGLDPDALRAAITERTRAVVPVHLYGYPARIAELTEIARDHDLFVLEDAAAAIGAALGNRTVGSWGDMAAFSFQGAKIVVAGEGG
ncbi:DegT/DnrJ/EryC1/StrS family aminotransferase, partial [Acinetobacter baumannii]